MSKTTDFERIGEERLRALVEVYVARFASDFIIGFLFDSKNLPRIARHEYELAAAHLGADTKYAGRPIGAVHGPLRINRGHFRRRLAIVRTVLREGGVDDDIIERWISYESSLEALVTDGTDCLE